MKKILIILGVIVALFGALLLTNIKTGQIDGSINPYGDKELRRTTIDGLKSGEYEHQITYEDFERKIFEEKEEALVYAFSPECIFCTQFNPIVNEVLKENDVNFYRLNLLEYPEAFSELNIEGTPMTLYFENGKEVDRLEGMSDKNGLEDFIKNNK